MAGHGRARAHAPKRLWLEQFVVAVASAHATGCKRVPALDESLLLLASEATEAIEAFALAITVVEAAVGAFGELGKVAKVGVVVDLTNGVGGGASATLGHVDLEEVLDTGLAGEVGEFDGEVHVGGGGGEFGVGVLAEVGAVLGVLVVADVVVFKGREVLDAVVEAVADRGGAGGGGDLDAFENFVGEGAEGVLDTGGGYIVVIGAINSVGAPDASVPM